MPLWKGVACVVCERVFDRSAKLRPKYCGMVCRDAGKSIEKECLVCAAKFVVWISHARRKFCSRTCKGIASRAERSPCAVCGRPFLATKHRPAKYCSRACSARRRKITQTKPCSVCFKPVTRQHKQFNARYRVYCSKDCEASARTGAASHLWRGGCGDKRGASWHIQRNRARKRDGYCCQRCGLSETDYGRQLDVHHLKPFRLFTDHVEANQLSNLLSVCFPCHVVLERLVDNG